MFTERGCSSAGCAARVPFAAMLDQDRIAAYRKMSLEERWREVEALMTFAWRTLKQLPHDEVARRLAHDQAERDKSDEAVLAHLRRIS